MSLKDTQNHYKEARNDYKVPNIQEDTQGKGTTTKRYQTTTERYKKTHTHMDVKQLKTVVEMLVSLQFSVGIWLLLRIGVAEVTG